jgi:hypothetical protein
MLQEDRKKAQPQPTSVPSYLHTISFVIFDLSTYHVVGVEKLADGYMAEHLSHVLATMSSQFEADLAEVRQAQRQPMTYC